MKYPITPDYIKNAPKEIERLYRALEAYILQDICERFKLSGQATATALEEIRELQRRGYSYADIEKYIKHTLKLTDSEYERIMAQAVSDNQIYYKDVLTASQLVSADFEAEVIQSEIDAIIAQCKGNLDNLTQSLGFSVRVNGQLTYLPIAQAYQRVLSDAEMKVWAGVESPSEAIREAVKQLADSGIRVVTYDNGNRPHVDHADVAARRAVMTGITQLSSKYGEQIREQVPTDYIEVSAHRGARDVAKPGIPWASHKAWQGKVYSVRTGDIYPNIYARTGWGEVDGLEGANCRHMHFPFWEGISERTYTDEELANIDPPPQNYKGHEYNAYAATQRQRQYERELRKIKRELLGYDAAGDTESYKTAATKYRHFTQEYEEFCKAMGLKPTERGNIAEFSPSDARKALKTLKMAGI